MFPSECVVKASISVRKKERWESDPVIGEKRKGEPAVLTIAERKTGDDLTLRIMEKTTAGGNCVWRLEINFQKSFAAL